MKKLKLDLDTLEVNSFETQPDDSQERGTIAAHSLVSTSPIGLPLSWIYVSAAVQQ